MSKKTQFYDPKKHGHYEGGYWCPPPATGAASSEMLSDASNYPDAGEPMPAGNTSSSEPQDIGREIASEFVYAVYKWRGMSPAFMQTQVRRLAEPINAALAAEREKSQGHLDAFTRQYERAYELTKDLAAEREKLAELEGEYSMAEHEACEKIEGLELANRGLYNESNKRYRLLAEATNLLREAEEQLRYLAHDEHSRLANQIRLQLGKIEETK